MTNVVKLPQPTADRFEEFWQAFPRRTHKALAKAKWLAITGPGLQTKNYDKDSNTYVEVEVLKATPQQLIDGAKRYYKNNRLNGIGEYGFKDGGRYLKHPATWLNQQGWLDE